MSTLLPALLGLLATTAIAEEAPLCTTQGSACAALSAAFGDRTVTAVDGGSRDSTEAAITVHVGDTIKYRWEGTLDPKAGRRFKSDMSFTASPEDRSAVLAQVKEIDDETQDACDERKGPKNHVPSALSGSGEVKLEGCHAGHSFYLVFLLEQPRSGGARLKRGRAVKVARIKVRVRKAGEAISPGEEALISTVPGTDFAPTAVPPSADRQALDSLPSD